jgi:hypothetical protein
VRTKLPASLASIADHSNLLADVGVGAQIISRGIGDLSDTWLRMQAVLQRVVGANAGNSSQGDKFRRDCGGSPAGALLRLEPQKMDRDDAHAHREARSQSKSFETIRFSEEANNEAISGVDPDPMCHFCHLAMATWQKVFKIESTWQSFEGFSINCHDAMAAMVYMAA